MNAASASSPNATGVLEGAGRAQRPGREEQRIARQKRRDDEAGFGKDDGEQQAVDPRAVGLDELEQVPVAMEEEIDHVTGYTLSSA